MSKSKAFVLTIVCIFIMFVIAIVMQFFSKLEGFPVGAFLTAIVTIGTGFITLQVANNGVMGKCFNEKLHEIESAKGY